MEGNLNHHLGCGVEEHEADCLCDVNLPDSPTPINYGLTDVWHVQTGPADPLGSDVPTLPMSMKLAMKLGVGKPWTGSDVADLGAALLQAYEAHARCKARTEGEDTTRRHEDAEVIIGLLAAGESIVDVPDLLDLDWADVMYALSRGKQAPYIGWDEHRWIEVEGKILDGITATPLGKQYGIDFRTAKRMIDWYRP